MRKLSLTSLAGVVLAILFFEGGQASDVNVETVEIGGSNNQTNNCTGCPATKTFNIYNVVRVDELRKKMFSFPESYCVNKFNKKDYVITPGIGAHKLFNRVVKWYEARDICVRDGAHLVVINSDAEEALIRRWMGNNSLQDVWVGVHDLFFWDMWVAITGESVSSMSYDPWATGRPSKLVSNSHCGVLRKIPTKGVDNSWCFFTYAFVCEKKLCPDA